jgi:hypothetical protein
VAIAVGAVLGLVLFGAWLARLSLGTRFVDRELAARGVPARYTLAGLGLRGQRLENVVLGDPANPDLVADWIETETGIGLSGPYLDGVRVGRVRIAARLVDGRVSLGSLDKLLPPPSGKPFALPALRVAGDDVRVRLTTPAGIVGLRLAGRGRLDDGFRGTLAAVAPRLAIGGCTTTGLRAAVRLSIADAALSIAGPVQADRVACGGAMVRGAAADLDVALGAALDRWQGTAALRAARASGAGVVANTATGRIDFAGSAQRTAGQVELTTAAVGAHGLVARWGRVAGRYAIGGGGVTLADAALDLHGLRVPATATAPVAALARQVAGTPVAPLAEGLARAIGAAGRSVDIGVGGWVRSGPEGGEAAAERVVLAAASGARATLTDSTTLLRWGGARPGAVIAGAFAMRGGGLPTLSGRIAQARPGAAFTGTARLAQPYAVGDARLMLTPVRFTAGGGGVTVVDTVATLSGPLGNGRIDDLTLPIRARAAAGTVTINPGCTPVAAGGLRIAGLRLDRPALTLCATGGALVRVAGGAVSGGARLPELRLRGTIGSSPLTIDGEGARIDLAARGFAIEGLRTRIGAADRATVLNFTSLDGRIAGGAVAGGFAGGTGRIGTVPLALGEATGTWRFAEERLGVDGALVVTDTAATPRFQPMRGQGVRLTLVDNRIDAVGTLVEPTTGTRVAGVTIAHALGSGVGHADLAVPGITFRTGFQPELLTRVTFGVIADVQGTVAGTGRIDWSPAGVTSTGRFRTDGTNLAAAFGPVTGLAGEIVFDDLLALSTPSGQVATVKEINPGIAVNDGVIRYRLLPQTRIAVESGRWPFAGGTLTLDPTTLDFGQEAVRRLTFRVTAAAADKFLQQFAFENLQATGTFDGVLPMVFDASGGRIDDGRLRMREGGGTIAYVGDLTQRDLGFWGNLAFQSLRSLRYRSLDITMNGPLAGEMVTEVKFAGVSQGAGAKSNFIIRRLQRLPFVFNIRIQAPFRGLLDSVQSFYDPKRLIGRNLPALLDAQNKANGPRVQPPASEKVP